MSKKRRDKKLQARNKGLTKILNKANVQDLISQMAMFNSPSFSTLNPPEGFRTISATQAMMTFAEPLQKLMKGSDIEAMNTMMGITTDIWNYTLPKVPVQQKKTQEEMVERLCEIFEMDETDAIDLFEEMVERKAYLLPDDIQPKDVRTMFIRKKETCQIEKFDESTLELSAEPIPLTEEDQEMTDRLHILEGMLAAGKNYDVWEDAYFKVEEACCTRYYEWLKAKQVPLEYANVFPYCIERFLDFCYRYDASGVTAISMYDAEDFLLEHLPRKVMVKPQEYTYWPPAIRLFYIFLAEKGVIEGPEPFVEIFDDVEEGFIVLLKKQFS